MSPDKDCHTAIRAARAAGRPLKIAAKASERDERRYFDAEIAPHLGGDIEFLEELGHADKTELLSGARGCSSRSSGKSRSASS
jgi:hypothetical protein